MKTNDDKSVTDSHTKSVDNEKVVRSELLNSIERKTPAGKIIGIWPHIKRYELVLAF